MGRYVTPRGVVVEVGDEAARMVGYKPADEPEKPAEQSAPKRTARKSSSSTSSK